MVEIPRRKLGMTMAVFGFFTTLSCLASDGWKRGSPGPFPETNAAINR
jgi:hypothetical protein